MTLPVIRSGEEKRERMALMEAAVSSSLDNPNIVKTHHYSIKPVRHQTSSRQIAQISAFEVHLVLEYCDLGSLRATLNSRIFHPGSQPDYIAIIHVAMDVALGMRYLHASNIIHADLKASNILLQSGRECMTAKISDFGLSISKLDPLMSHVSGHFQGTMTHMSPECLLIGKQSFAGDVYSFAITLYELYTAENAFAGIPAAMFGHKVCQEHHRPIFPPGTPIGYRQLAEACWDPLPSARPTFNDVVTALAGLGRDQGEYLDISFDLSDCSKHVGHQGIPQAPPHSLPQQPVPIEPKELTTNDRQFWVNLFNGVQM
jgi:serine/threonine protein kinase